jgi:hypothetical protein
MLKLSKTITCAAFLGATMLTAAPAYAQATRTWVSGVGDDANPCSRTAPCKTFAGAISKTAVAGEINCLDPGGFGTLTITKSITVDCPSTVGGVLAGGVNGFTINAAGIVVTLRNVIINGAGFTTGNGVRILAAAQVNLDNVTIENFAGTTATNGRGVAIETAANVVVNLQNSRLQNLGSIAVHSTPTAGTVTLNVSNTQITHNGTTCIDLRQNTNAVIFRSEITDCGQAVGGAGLTAELTSVTAQVSNSLIANNNAGIFVGNGGTPTVRIYGNVITGNIGNGLAITAGQILSHGNNAIRGNGGNETPSGASLGMQ